MKVILALLALFLVFRPTPAAAQGTPNIVQVLAGTPEEPPPPELHCPSDAKLCAFNYRFQGDVSDDSVASFQRFMEAAKKAGGKAVMLEITSPGGDTDAGHEITRTIEMSSLRVYCIADGNVASAAMYIFQSCDRRYMTKRAILTTHNVIFRTDGSQSITLYGGAELLNGLAAASGAFAEQIVHRAKNLTMAEYRAKIAHGDWSMGWAEALHYGFVDSVLDVNPNMLYLSMLRDKPL